MSYVELNDKYNSIIDTRGIRSIGIHSISGNYHYIEIHYSNKEGTWSYEYKNTETLYEDRDRIKEKLGF